MKYIKLPFQFLLLITGLTIWGAFSILYTAWKKAHGIQVDNADLT